MSELTTITESIIGTVIVKDILMGWLNQSIASLCRKLFVRTKRSYIIWIHTVRHMQKSPDHDKKLFTCRDSPCDLLTVEDHDLGLPVKSPVSK